MLRLILTVTLMTLLSNSFAKGRFSPTITLFENFHQGFGGQNDVTKFEHRRGYIGVKYRSGGAWSGQLIFDLSTAYIEDERLVFSADMKNAFVAWSKHYVTVCGGVIKTMNYGLKESGWGYRYITRCFEDRYGFAPSADIGVTVEYDLSDKISADFTFTNGKGHEIYDVTGNFRYGFGVTYNPIEELTLRTHYDYYTREARVGRDQHSASIYVSYARSFYSIGWEYNYQFNRDFVAGADASGFSFFTTLHINDKVRYFARYDKKFTTNSEVFEAGDVIRTGFDYEPIKYIRISPNILSERTAGEKLQTFVYLNLLVRY